MMFGLGLLLLSCKLDGAKGCHLFRRSIQICAYDATLHHYSSQFTFHAFLPLKTGSLAEKNLEKTALEWNSVLR